MSTIVSRASLAFLVGVAPLVGCGGNQPAAITPPDKGAAEKAFVIEPLTDEALEHMMTELVTVAPPPQSATDLLVPPDAQQEGSSLSDSGQ